ncbi:LysM domain-containing protein [Saccharopolyspora erythraea NRRL 2338]|uniref:Secreted protein n=2 Tax=Saccharopolyspora erythraea TaxID=1836 RepID=A4F788_SACEN|nr:transglycosylase family protein [Saccharopolyspora erythraea]EQD86350.1 transglycosylase [Saccharopolyspora erythraea D]PFG93715.1 LysM domain-containing protein [Saccharopolyspora erythraea NRRL 2338]QRK90557.1 transglycosylase family protein [Saccharopolyspora erythraea]CAL99912.1 secreted protein [Saccharopolyspora erythraea NRRL 2338]
MARYHGKHRKPSNAARAAARVAVAGAVIATPLAIAAPANAADWDALAQCESSGNWSANTGNGFSGGLQFTPSTWAAYGGTQYASNAKDATREEQIAVAEKVLASQGKNAWPGCSAKLNWSGGSTKTTKKVTKTETKTQTRTQTKTTSPVQTGGGDYTVQLGDTLGKIGEKFGVDYKKIAERNSDIIKDPNLIFPGQKLDIK